MHWYDQQGNPVYTVPRADGKGERDTNLRDARKLYLLPSVTEIIKVKASPGLENWKIQQAYLAMATLPEKPGETVDDRIRRAKADAAEQAKVARELGSDIHNALERYFKGETCPYVHLDKAKKVDRLLRERFGQQSWVAEHAFGSHRGYGGKIDLMTPEIIVDFKTKEFDDPEKKLAYPDMAMQLDAYRKGMEVDARMVNVFISTNADHVVIHEWEEADYYSGFEALLHYWIWEKQYDPRH